jgi:hypothetical protein
MRKMTEKTLQALRGNLNTLCTLRGSVHAMFVVSDFENSNFRDKVDFRHIPKRKERPKLNSMLGSQDKWHSFCHLPSSSTDGRIFQNVGMGLDRRVQKICLLTYDLTLVRSVSHRRSLIDSEAYISTPRQSYLRSALYHHFFSRTIARGLHRAHSPSLHSYRRFIIEPPNKLVRKETRRQRTGHEEERTAKE